MTITYSGEVPNGSSFGCFWKILCKWRGSVYKLVWRELVAYLFLYYSINLVYRFGLTEHQQRIFEKIRLYFSQQSESIPMSFVLGFYVTLVVKRWWEQYKLLPWPDTLALFLNAGIPGGDERQRLMRRNIVRYAVLAYVITLKRVSLRVKKRFPTWQHVVDSGLMMESEKKIFELMDEKTPMSKYWMPLVWATNIINRARKESLITSDHIVQTLLMELSDIRRRLGSLIGYDTVCVPLVYTQVVTLALYTYFIAALMGRQFVPNATGPVGKFEEPDMYFPFFTALQFCFYVGWLKVAEVLINPFGEDDDDIELNWLIDRHIKAAYMIVDEMHEEHPELLKDQYWEEVVPKELPYTVASEHYRREEPKGSAEHYKIKTADAMYANLIAPRKAMVEDMYADYESVDTPIVQRRKSSNWFTRQISRTRMGSVRSASTAYSSDGLFSRHRGNSVYINPENGQVPAVQTKMSIYDRLVGRKSGRNQKSGKGVNKHNGSTVVPIKSRPRIPTPDVTKEVVDRENRLAIHSAGNMQNQIAQSVTLMPPQLQTSYQAYAGTDVPVVQVLLSPIQELDGTGSVNNTLHPGQPGTAALAQAVLSPGLGPVLTTPVSLPMALSHVTTIGLASVNNSPCFARHINQQLQQQQQQQQQHQQQQQAAQQQQPSSRSPGFTRAFEEHMINTPPTSIVQPLTLTEVTLSDEENERRISSRSSNSSAASDASNSSKDTKESRGSNQTNTTASVCSKNSIEEEEYPKSSPSPGTSNATTPMTSLVSSVEEPPVPRKTTQTGVTSTTTAAPAPATTATATAPKRGEVYV